MPPPRLSLALVGALAGSTAAFLLGVFKRRRNLAAWRRRRAGRTGPPLWAQALARRICSGELERQFVAELEAEEPGANGAPHDVDADADEPPLASITLGGGGFRTISYIGQVSVCNEPR